VREGGSNGRGGRAAWRWCRPKDGLW